MRIESDYSYELPDDHAATIIAGIGDDIDRGAVLAAIDVTEDGEPVRLSLHLADTLLAAYAEWEREQEGGE